MATYKIFDAVMLRTFVARRRKRNKSTRQIAANLHSVTYEPQPIVDLRNKIVLLWSAKAGSVFAINWMFKHMGLLEEALAFHACIDFYGLNVFCIIDRSKSAVEDFFQSPSSHRV